MALPAKATTNIPGLMPCELILLIASHLDTNDLNCMVQACRQWHDLLSPQLYKQGALKIDSDDKTPIVWAVRRGRRQTVQRLLDSGASPNVFTIWGSSPMSEAAQIGDVETLRLLTNYMTEEERPRDCLASHLGLAAWSQSSSSTMEFLLDMYVLDEEELNKLMHYVALRTCVIFLLIRPFFDRGADIGSKNAKGETLLAHAIGRADVAAVRLLLDLGADVEGLQPDRALHLAVKEKSVDIVQMLIGHGADLEARDALGDTVLHLAVSSFGAGVTTALCRAGVEVDRLSSGGYTPLYCAAAWPDCSSVLLVLLEAGADPCIADPKTGKTPLHAARSAKVATPLLEAGASITAVDWSGGNALYCAAAREEEREEDKAETIPLLEVLLREARKSVWEQPEILCEGEDGLDESAKDRVNPVVKFQCGTRSGITRYWIAGTALHDAAMMGRNAVAELLLKSGADPFMPDLFGRSALDWVCPSNPALRETMLAFAGGDRATNIVQRTEILKRTLRILVTNLLGEQNPVQQECDIYTLGKTLICLGDDVAARQAFAVPGHPMATTPHMQFRCLGCYAHPLGQDIRLCVGGRFVCKTCLDVRLCEECSRLYVRPDRPDWIEWGVMRWEKRCRGHKLLEIQAGDREFLADEPDCRGVRGREWLEGLFTKYQS